MNVLLAQQVNIYMMDIVYKYAQHITMKMTHHGHVNHVYHHVFLVKVHPTVLIVLIIGIYMEKNVFPIAQNH